MDIVIILNKYIMKRRTIIALFAVAFLWSCSTTMQYTWTKENYEGRKYNKILVIAEAQTQSGRTNAETAIVDALTKEGITATNSMTVFPPGENTHDLSEEEIENRILERGYDGVLITSLVDAKSREVREGGGTYTQPVYACWISL